LVAFGVWDAKTPVQIKQSVYFAFEILGSPILNVIYMAEKKKKLKSIKRFGARYGRRVKHKLAEVEAIQRGEHICPYCRAPKAKRLAVGIWKCAKCGAKFTGKAYSVKKEIKVKEKGEEEPEEESQEE